MISNRSSLSITSSRPSILSIPTPRSTMLSIPTPRSSILSDDATTESITKTEELNDAHVSASNLPDQDGQESRYRGGQVHRYRRRITFTGVPPIPENDSDVKSCIVVTNTIQVEILNETKSITEVDEMQKDKSNSESDA